MKLMAAVLISACAFGQSGVLPTPEGVLSRYIDALGGSAALEKIKTRVAQGRFEVPTFGANGSYTEHAKAPAQVLQTFNVENYGVVQRCFDGQAAWAEDPERGVEALTGARAAEVKRSAGLLWPARLSKLYSRLAVIGKEKTGGRDAFVIQAAAPDGIDDKLFFDAETGLLIGLESKETGADGNVTPFSLQYEDYRAVDGIQLPHLVRYQSVAMTWIVRLTSVVHGAAIEDGKFKRPGA
jgi:hypothetical protein